MFFLQSPCILFISAVPSLHSPATPRPHPSRRHLVYRVITSRRRTMKKAVSSAAAVDRISELPEGIIHGILARLESHESAARTSILSKRWLRLWSTFPFVEFKHYYGREKMQRKFQSFAAATSKRLLAAVPPLPLESFTIELPRREVCDQTRQSLHQLLSSVAGGRSSPIKVVVKTKLFGSSSSVNPPTDGGMFLSFRRTKFMYLGGFDLSGLHSFKTCLDNLQELSLLDVRVSKQSFPSCLANAPRLKKLELRRISQIDHNNLDISASNFPSLVYLHFVGYAPYLHQLQLSSDTVLQSLRIWGRCKFLKLVSAPSVKTVYLSPNEELGYSEREKLISKFPSLESLYFNASFISGDSKLRVSSGTLRELTFEQGDSKMELEIDTPNLETLTINTDGLKLNLTVVNVPPSCRCVFDCAKTGRMKTSWFIKLRKCLAALATHFRQLVFKLDIYKLTKAPELDLSQVGHECTPLAVRHLLMATDFRDSPQLSPFNEAHRTRLLDGLLWTLDPKELSVAMTRYDSSLSSYISEQIELKNLEECCSNGRVITNRRRTMKKAVSSAAAVDRISELPEGIIHGILARLESHESAARTSILSKRWLRLWSTFPVVEFKGDYGREGIQSKFQSFAAATSKRLLAAVPPLPLDSFDIDLQLEPDFEQLRQCLNQLLLSVAGGRSSPIKVVVKTKLFESNSSVSAPIDGGMFLNFRRTKFLELEGFDLSGLHSFKPDNLQTLSLKDVRVCSQSFLSFLASAPCLKRLSLRRIPEIDHNTLDISASNFPSSPLLLDSFNLNLRAGDDLGKGLYQLLSSVSVGVEDGGRSSPIKVVVENNKDISASHVGGMLLTCHRTKFLNLKGFDLSRLHNFKTCLDNLQELSLEHIQVSRQSFPSCLANAPRLEKLKLKYIIGIDSLDISASNFPSLVSLEFVGFFPYLQQLQLSSDTLLQTLRFVGRCKFLKLVSAPNVKTVHLSPLDEFGCSELEKLISKFPSLESLYFNAIYISGKFKLRVSSPTLRELTFKQLVSKMEFEIDTPNLETLTIDTTTLDINSTVINVHPSCRFVFACPITIRITTSWFIELRNCLAALATHFRQLVFKLDISYSTKVPEFDLCQVGHECTPLAVRHLLMATDFRSQSTFEAARNLFDGLLWTVHPQELSVAVSSSNSSLFSYISEQIEMKNLENCCSNGKCWRHQFKDAKITSVMVDDVSTIDESMISQPSIDIWAYEAQYFSNFQKPVSINEERKDRSLSTLRSSSSSSTCASTHLRLCSKKFSKAADSIDAETTGENGFTNMAEDPEKKFHSIMDKLFSTPAKPSLNPSSLSNGESSRGRKRPCPDSALSFVEPRSAAADIFDAFHRSSVAQSDAPLCRPWDRGDLMRRLATFKSMTWFAKPKVVMLLMFESALFWGLFEKAALVFSLKLDSGHKLMCPWVDNACDERLAEFPPTPFPVLVEKFKERSSKLLHLLALPVVSSSAIEHMRSPQLEDFLSQSTTLDLGNGSVSMSQMEFVGNENEGDNAKLYYQAQKLISLCGWVPRSLSYVVDCMEKPTDSERWKSSLPESTSESSGINVHSAAVEERAEVTEEAGSNVGSRVDPNSVVLDCGLCGASVGLWAYSTVPRPMELFRVSGNVEMTNNTSTGQETEDPANKGGAASSSSNSILSPPSSMKFTIAGGPPPTKQNFKATISVPVIGRNLRARLSDDINFGDRSNGSQVDLRSQSDKQLPQSETSDQEQQVSGTNNEQPSGFNAEGSEAPVINDNPQQFSEPSTSVASVIEPNQAENKEESQKEGEVVVYDTGKDSSGGTTMDFDPIRQHRHFCPWIISSNSGAPGWQQTLTALQRQNDPSSSSPKTPPSSSSIIKVDDPITSVRKLFRSPSSKRTKLTPGSS
ncbi:F-box/LRR-repeat protein At1g52650 [Linum perenne]